MTYIYDGSDICPFYTKIHMDILCTCNSDGTFSVIDTKKEEEVPPIPKPTYNCKLWDFDNARCGTQVTDIIKQPTTENSCLMIQLESTIGKTSEKASAEGTGSSLLREVNHIHGAHWHPSSHECPEIPVSCGTSNNAFSMPFATVLVAEYMGGQDLDDNDFIYGRDFMIADSYDKPLMLKPIESTPEWEDPPISIGWQELLNWSKTKHTSNPSPDPLESYR